MEYILLLLVWQRSQNQALSEALVGGATEDLQALAANAREARARARARGCVRVWARARALRVCVCVCACACVDGCMCVCVCARACVRARARVRVRVCLRAREAHEPSLSELSQNYATLSESILVHPSLSGGEGR